MKQQNMFWTYFSKVLAVIYCDIGNGSNCTLGNEWLLLVLFPKYINSIVDYSQHVWNIISEQFINKVLILLTFF
jgi:hypothetical protein